MRYEQSRGASLVFWLLVVSLVALVGLGALKLFPIFLEHHAVTRALKGVEQHEGFEEGLPVSAHLIRDRLSRRFEIESIRRIDLKKDLEITPEEGGFRVTIHYEARTPYLSNIDFVVRFEDDAWVKPQAS